MKNLKHIPNIISISRIFISIYLLFLISFSIDFLLAYIYCGISDVLDGVIARKMKTTSNLGATLDSVSDAIFCLVWIYIFVFQMKYPMWLLWWIDSINKIIFAVCWIY